MHHYQIIGINHRTANAALLSALSLNGQRREVFLKKINAAMEFDGFVLSTCNRTEVYFKNASHREILAAWSATVCWENLPTDKLYHFTGYATVEHLYRVTCGLDSKIIGDNEILGQLKEAFLFQKENYGLGGVWERIVGTAIECSRRVRKETDFNKGSISTPYRIAKIIQQKTRAEEPVLLIGAGEMIKLCLKYLRKILPARKLVITNRSIEKARLLAVEFGADYFHFGQLETEMQNFPIIVSAIQVEQPLFHAVFLKKDNPHLLFDLGIPCNFSEEVASAHHYFDIQTIAEFNAATLEQRTNDIRKVEAIVAEQVAQFEDWNRRRLFYRNQKLGNSISLV
ncbi:MAG: glutamyl-tRNA reductase [Saprospiraceae bacterium]